MRHEALSIQYTFGGHSFLFQSDAGLFSKNKVDFATDLLLRCLPPLSGSFLDLGCGYGCIGTVLGQINSGLSITMADVSPRALEYARRNAVQNGVAAEVIHSDGFDKLDALYDAITLNPPIHAGKAVVWRLYEGAYEHLRPGGVFYVVIQRKHGAPSSQARLTEIFGACRAVYAKKGFFVFACVKQAA